MPDTATQLEPGRLYVRTFQYDGDGGEGQELICISAVDGHRRLRLERQKWRDQWGVSGDWIYNSPGRPTPTGSYRAATDEDLDVFLSEWAGNGGPLSRFTSQGKVLPEEIERARVAWYRQLDHRVDLDLPIRFGYVPTDYTRDRQKLADHPDAWKLLARGLLKIRTDSFFNIIGNHEIEVEPLVELVVHGAYFRLTIGDTDDTSDVVEFKGRPGSSKLAYPDSIGNIISTAPAPFQHILRVLRRSFFLADTTTRGSTGNIPVDKALDANVATVIKMMLAQLNEAALAEITLIEKLG